MASVEIPSADDAFINQVEAALRQSAPELYCDKPTILVAFSGGPDSTALLAALSSLTQQRAPFAVAAYHVNHGLRAAESDAEEAHCASICAALRVPFQSCRLNGQIADEARLRAARYAALLDQAKALRAAWIATGHNLNDQIETVLFRLFRGTAAKGIVGIPHRRMLTREVCVLRPLLSLHRAEILSFLERFQIPHCNDSSNQLTNYARNFIRHEVVPKITERFPSAIFAIERFRQSIVDDEQALSALACMIAHQSKIDNNRFSSARMLDNPRALVKRVIASLLQERHIEVTEQRLQAVLSVITTKPGRLSLSDDWDIETSEDALCFIHKDDMGQRENAGAYLEVPANVPGMTPLPEYNLCLKIEACQGDLEPVFPAAGADEAVVDLTRTVPPLVVRRRRPGDRIRPFGMVEQVRLKKYLHTHKSRSPINPEGSLVLADAREVLWVPGVGLSDVVKAGRLASHILRLFSVEDEA